jgi:AcrR family transcriptional regulator
LPHRQNSEKPRSENRSKRQERAERILDAAAALVQRWGYNKTTIDDIAKQAGVAKGTIYLHWKTREALFQALLTREYLTMLQEFLQRLGSDPESATLHGITRQAFLLSMTRPLVKGMMLGDTDMLGELAHREYADPAVGTLPGGQVSRFIVGPQRRIEMGRTYIELLRSKGLVRTDMSIQAQIHMLLAISIGFLVADRFLPVEYKLSPGESADLLAETAHRTFEPGEPVTFEKVQEVHTIFVQLLNQLIDAVKERIQREAEL